MSKPSAVMILCLAIMPLIGCTSDIVVHHEVGAIKTLVYTEDHPFRSVANKEANALMPDKADEVCPNGWQAVSQSSRPLGDGKYEHAFKVKCF